MQENSPEIQTPTITPIIPEVPAIPPSEPVIVPVETKKKSPVLFIIAGILFLAVSGYLLFKQLPLVLGD